MFTPIHLLPQYDPEKERRYSERWNTDRGLVVKDKILDLIRKGGGEDFLLRYLTRHELNVLSDHWDLKGIELFEEQIDFPVDIDNFEGIDFSYASLYHCKFNNAVFGSVGFSFTRFYNCELVNCFFGYTNFYGANLEGTKYINCDFAENNTITNCDLRGVVFENCFMPSNLFFDCRFDEKTVVHQLALKPIASKKNLKLDESELAEIYKGISEGYRSGKVIKKSRLYFFKERQAITRYNSKGILEKIGGYFIEWVAGYGIRPFRVLSTMIVTFLVFSVAFILRIGFSEGLVLSAGAFFTFGANNYLLSTLCTFWKVMYIVEAYFGISLMALFITILANYWFRER